MTWGKIRIEHPPFGGWIVYEDDNPITACTDVEDLVGRLEEIETDEKADAITPTPDGYGSGHPARSPSKALSDILGGRKVFTHDSDGPPNPERAVEVGRQETQAEHDERLSAFCPVCVARRKAEENELFNPDSTGTVAGSDNRQESRSEDDLEAIMDELRRQGQNYGLEMDAGVPSDANQSPALTAESVKARIDAVVGEETAARRQPLYTPLKRDDGRIECNVHSGMRSDRRREFLGCVPISQAEYEALGGTATTIRMTTPKDLGMTIGD